MLGALLVALVSRGNREIASKTSVDVREDALDQPRCGVQAFAVRFLRLQRVLEPEFGPWL